MALQAYWTERGCLLWQPHDLEVGAGTFNPATFLRALGPEPWKVAYVEPSRRPTDGRYGDNPNRLHLHHQFQVILKPSPDDIQDLYLDSLRAIGIDPLEHDIRFVEDDWESPTLGAWGLGWEVWVDGMEVTQFTYFQQVGSIDCRPVSVELTYGLERLSMYVQGVEDVFDLRWNARAVLRRRPEARRVRVERLQLRAGRHRPALHPVRLLREGRGPRPGGRAGPSRLRLRPQVLARLQPAGRARGDQRHRAHRLHRPGARAGAPGGPGLLRAARGSRLPPPQGRRVMAPRPAAGDRHGRAPLGRPGQRARAAGAQRRRAAGEPPAGPRRPGDIFYTT